MALSESMQLLVREHHVIEKVVNALATTLDTSERSGEVPFEFLDRTLVFLARFADCRHHAKEEWHLFPALEARGLPHDAGPIACMLHEHSVARGHIRQANALLNRVRAGDAQAWEELRSELAAYIVLIRNHIAKENQVLFVLADRLLTAEERLALHERMLEAEKVLNAEQDVSVEMVLAEALVNQATPTCNAMEVGRRLPDCQRNARQKDAP